MLEKTLAILNKQVETIKIKSDPIKLSVRLDRKKRKWLIAKDQDEAVSNLFMAFVAGSENADSMNQDLEEALDSVTRDVVDSLDKPTAPIAN